MKPAVLEYLNACENNIPKLTIAGRDHLKLKLELDKDVYNIVHLVYYV